MTPLYEPQEFLKKLPIQEFNIAYKWAKFHNGAGIYGHVGPVPGGAACWLAVAQEPSISVCRGQQVAASKLSEVAGLAWHQLVQVGKSQKVHELLL